MGIPLVEIATAPDIKSPSHARQVAEQIGMILRSTGKVKRGLGTIRQDVNISIAKGARVEIKGVQSLDLIEDIVHREVERQLNLLLIRQELLERKAIVCEDIYNVTELFIDTKSKVLQKFVEKGVILAALLRKFKGLIGREIQPGRRLGTELSDRAKTAGVGGIFHTDELPNYGITENEVHAVRNMIVACKDDVIILVKSPKKLGLQLNQLLQGREKSLKESRKKPERPFQMETLLICVLFQALGECTLKLMFLK